MRIVTPEISDRNNFVLTNRFAGNTKTYHIVLKAQAEVNYHFVLGLLNSRLLQFFYCAITAPMAGGFFAYKTQFLKSIPIRNDDNLAMRSIVAIVQKILAAKKRDSGADTTAWERQIDCYVYELYGLTQEEIRTVEGVQ